MKTRLLPLLVVAAVFVLCQWAVQPSVSLDATSTVAVSLDSELPDVTAKVDAYFERMWARRELKPATAADELLLLRRLALSLMGTVPSLEEVRQFELDDQPKRIERWTQRYLSDQRFADYFAERLARCFVGVEGGQFIVFRRDRFVSWLSDQLAANEPYDNIVRQLISSKGLWTGEPQTNFITSAVANDDLDENKLAARSVRAFLGQSMDCAQCHDHPFNDKWQQGHFEGIAAQFGQAETGGLGVYDQTGKVYEVEDRVTLKTREVAPKVPFGSEWLPDEGTSRERFAHWITHRENRQFDSAIANRVWGLLFGRSFITPVDDMPKREEAEEDYEFLDLLGQDFRQHNHDLRRLITVIVSSKPFRQQSVFEPDEQSQPDVSYQEMITILDESWGLFPMTRLRPEQIIGSMLQASTIQTIDQNSHLFTRFRRFTGERDFVREYGDLGDKELVEHTGTIPQALLRMNSDMTRDAVKSDIFSACGRISNLCTTNEDVLDAAYLACLTRRPSPLEREHFLGLLGNHTDNRRNPVVEDIFWSLFNSPEFSWNH
ncbi:MAG: DUF1549 domain-containing protein [Planctomycetota bacterium]|nr:DUF1549 domain-containing protein [Planctomycetota bacterium]